MILAWTSLGERLDIDEYWRRSVCYNLVNGLRVQKQENARTFLRDSTINWGRCHGGTPPESYIKQIRRGWLRQLWPNILVCMCRDEDLSANPSRAPVYCGLCIDFWAPQLMTSAGSVAFHGGSSHFFGIKIYPVSDKTVFFQTWHLTAYQLSPVMVEKPRRTP